MHTSNAGATRSTVTVSTLGSYNTLVSQTDAAFPRGRGCGHGRGSVSGNGTATKQSWYKVAVDYWDRQPATVDGVLGGYEDIHETESQTSERMIREHLKHMPGKGLALDCGAGIGRVTKTVLKHIFRSVDLLEPSKTQMVEARKYCPEARKFHHVGLQEFEYREPYDAIWIQWVLCYLTDEDIVHFLIKTKRDGLTRDEKGKTGLIFIKENTSEQS